MKFNQILIFLGLTILSLVGSASPLSDRHLLMDKRHSGFISPVLSDLNRAAFYQAMQEENKALVIAELEELQAAPQELRPAFTGAMLMKKASFSGSASSKLHNFKEGHNLLEEAIKKNPDNTEFRFLRLMIQEHSPGVLGYKGNIENDCKYIRKNYRSLPVDVQHVIEDYNKKSKFLKLDVS